MNSDIEEKIQRSMAGDNSKNLVLVAQSLLIAFLMVHPVLKVIWIFIAFVYLLTYLSNRQKGKMIVKIISATTEDLPDEIKEKLKGVDEMMKDFIKSKQKRCDDPHCPNCWGDIYNKEKHD